MLHKRQSGRRALSAARLPLWLLFALSVSLSAVGCWGQILDNDYEVIHVDGGTTPPTPPSPRSDGPAQEKALPDSATSADATGADATGSEAEPPDAVATKVYYSDVFKGLLNEFCVRCHGADGARSRIDAYGHITHGVIAKKATSIEYWTYVWERLKKGEMPPVKPDAGDEKQRLTDGLALFERWALAGFPNDPGSTPIPNDKGKEDPRTIFPSSATCKGVTPMPSRLWRLTTQQIRNSIHDIFGSTIVIPTFYLSARRTGGLSNGATNASLDNVDVTTLVQQFEAVSKEVFVKNSRWKACLGQKDNACVKQLIAEDGRLLWRRALTQAESDKLLSGFDTLAPDSREVALAYVLERMLLSPHFLFRSELGEPEPGKAELRRLTHHEVAAFLSYSLWQSAPDAALIKAADEKRLGTAAEVQTEIQRMLVDDRARRGVAEFFTDWLHIRELLNQEKDAAVFKGLTDKLRQDVVTSAIQFLEYMTWEQKGSIADVFDSDVAFVNEAIAKLYTNIQATGTAMQQVKVDASKRAGILTTPAFLMAQAGKDTTGFVHRGVFFLEELLCSPVGDPPMGAVAAGLERVAKTDTSKLTQREIMEKIHSADPSCNSCHKKIDPIGAAFELFSPLGQYRVTENGKSIDPSGKIEGFGDMQPQFSNAVELIKNLASSQHFRQCLTLKLYTHLWGRPPEGDRNCAVASMYEHLKGKQFQLLQVHQALLDNQQFFLRTVPKDK